MILTGLFATAFVILLAVWIQDNRRLVREMQESIRAEQARAHELLTLVEAQRAPSELLWATNPFPVAEPVEYRFDDTGLISYVVDNDV